MLRLIARLSVFLFVLIVLFSLHPPTASVKTTPTSTPQPAPRKRALLVGVSDYCPPNAPQGECAAHATYWWNLHSYEDIEALRNSLQTKFGFDPKDIKVLTTKAETTHKSIVDTFKSFLIQQTKPGDIVYFHYSGHGTQVLDDNGDELDGLDETLVPSDYGKQNDGSNNIRDDEIGALLSELKSKNPGSITVTMDSCYSGSNTRGGDHIMRGAEYAGPKPKGNPNAKEESASGLLTRGAAQAQGFVVISATSPKQLAGETPSCNGKQMGVFTCALVAAFNDARENTTYRDLFEKVNDSVLKDTRNQDPQFEGSRDQRVMNLGASPPQPYVLVETVGKRIVLQAGTLQGMTVGSRFDIFPKGVDPKDNNNPIAQAEISRVDLTTSILTLTSPDPVPPTLDLHLTRAVETLHNFGDKRLQVDAAGLSGSQNAAVALKTISDLKMVNTGISAESPAQVSICRKACKDEVKTSDSPQAQAINDNSFALMREDGSIIARFPDDANLAPSLKKSLEAEARWRYVKEVIKNDDKYINLKFRIVPVKIDLSKCDFDKNPDCNPTTDMPQVGQSEGGVPILHGGDLVQLEFLNTGNLPVYVTVLDLRSDGTIGPIWPHPCVKFGNAGENLIEISHDGKWKRLPWRFTIEIQPPYGPEMFKAIATKDPAEYSALIDPPRAGRRARGNAVSDRGARESKTPLGQLLLGAAAPMLTRGDPPFINFASISVRPMNWATVEFSFEAVPGATTDFKESDCQDAQ
jgi:hypothetical protein